LAIACLPGNRSNVVEKIALSVRADDFQDLENVAYVKTSHFIDMVRNLLVSAVEVFSGYEDVDVAGLLRLVHFRWGVYQSIEGIDAGIHVVLEDVEISGVVFHDLLRDFAFGDLVQVPEREAERTEYSVIIWFKPAIILPLYPLYLLASGRKSILPAATASSKAWISAVRIATVSTRVFKPVLRSS